MKTIQLNNVVWKEGGYFAVQCLNVDISNFGDTKEKLQRIYRKQLNCFEDNDQPEFNT